MSEEWPVKDVSVLAVQFRAPPCGTLARFVVLKCGWLTFLQIVYTSIVGFLMLAAFLEWFLWIGAFMYCLWKVFRKSEHWTVNVLAVIIAVAFLLLR